MTPTPPPACAAADEVRELGDALSSVTGENIRVVAVARRPCEFATLFTAEVLTATLDDGREMRLFVKHCDDRQADHPDKERRDREVQVYQQLFNGNEAALPVVRHYASRRNAAGHLELCLEYVDDWSLRYHHLPLWCDAARRLADLHAYFAQRADRLRECGFLLHLDASYFHRWAERARAALASQAPALARRIALLLTGYDPACALLASQLPTLVHNDLACKNVIADRSTTPARICIVDWELAGVGCGLLDLVHLKYGLDAAADQAMVDAYRAHLAKTQLLPADEVEFARTLAACELHKTLYRLAHSPQWNLPVDRLAHWVGEAEASLESVRTP